MDKKLLLNNLYDYYQELLTDKQRSYFENYYFNDLSLKEISENNNVSRNAIFNQLKFTEEKLLELERKMKLYEKGEKIKLILKDNPDILNVLESLI